MYVYKISSSNWNSCIPNPLETFLQDLYLCTTCPQMIYKAHNSTAVAQGVAQT